MLFIVLNHSQIIFSLCRLISSRLYVYLISNQKVLILLTRCFWDLSIIIQSQSPFVTPSLLASPPLTFLFNPKRQTVILGDQLDLLSLLLRKSKCLVKEVFEPDGRRRRIVEKWQREGSPGRGRHVCKVVKIGTCEVYLRRYQITRLEHEVREREFWKIWLERLVNQDREDLESQIKEFRGSFGIRWGFGIEHSGRMCVGGRSLWWMNYRRGTVEVEKPTMDFSNIISFHDFLFSFLNFTIYQCMLRKGRNFHSLWYPQSLEQCLAHRGAQWMLVELNAWGLQDPKILGDFSEFTQLIVTDPILKIAADPQFGVLLTVMCSVVLWLISLTIAASFLLVNSYLNFWTHFFQQMSAHYLVSSILLRSSSELLFVSHTDIIR